MATRQEEFNNLCTMYNALVDIEQLEKDREDCKTQISEYEKRTVKEYPDYVPFNFNTHARSEIEEHEKKASRIITLLSAIPSIIYGIIGATQIWQAGNDSIGDIILFVVLFFGPLLCIAIPRFGHIIAAAAQLLFGAFLSLSGEEGVIYRNIFFIGAAILVGAYIAWWISYRVFKAAYKKKADKIYDEAIKLESEKYAKYLKDKAVADVEIERQKRELKQDTETKCAHLRQKIAEINDTIESKKDIIRKTPGLAEEDKHMYILNALITYFRRGKADSIKEAINIFDAEEREKKRDEEAEKHRRMLQYQQSVAIMDMQDAQRRHNERMANEQHMQNEAVKRRLDRINDKVDEYIDEAKRNS